MINQTGKVEPIKNTRVPFFTGFSTVDRNLPPYTLTNIDLVKRDIQNHFSTPVGSRVMLPEFGTRIHELLFEPFDDYTRNAIIEDAVNVIDQEPRVELVNIDVTRDEHTLALLMTLLFKPENVASDLYVTFSLKDQSSF